MTKNNIIYEVADKLDKSDVPHIFAAIDPEGRGVGHAVRGNGGNVIAMLATIIGESFEGNLYKEALKLIEANIDGVREGGKHD